MGELTLGMAVMSKLSHPHCPGGHEHGSLSHKRYHVKICHAYCTMTSLSVLFLQKQTKKKTVHSRPPIVHPKLWVYRLLCNYWLPYPRCKVPTNQVRITVYAGEGEWSVSFTLFIVSTTVVQWNVRFITTLCMLRKWPCSCACMYSRLHLSYNLDFREGTFLGKIQRPSLSELCVCAVIIWWPI